MKSKQLMKNRQRIRWQTDPVHRFLEIWYFSRGSYLLVSISVWLLVLRFSSVFITSSFGPLFGVTTANITSTLPTQVQYSILNDSFLVYSTTTITGVKYCFIRHQVGSFYIIFIHCLDSQRNKCTKYYSYIYCIYSCWYTWERYASNYSLSRE